MSSVQFGNDYYDSLQTLTFNSRPIIESHTQLAQENVEHAAEIVKAVEKRISKAIPTQKLFALYLLDSICKVVGSPYTRLFSINLYKTFTQTYSLVDDPTRVKMIKLFKTWKMANPVTGMPLFNDDQLDLIEKFLIRATANNKVEEPLSKEVLLKDIDDLKRMVGQRLNRGADQKTKQRFELLDQLRNIISQPAQIPVQQLEVVRRQLAGIREDEYRRAQPPPFAQPVPTAPPGPASLPNIPPVPASLPKIPPPAPTAAPAPGPAVFSTPELQKLLGLNPAKALTPQPSLQQPAPASSGFVMLSIELSQVLLNNHKPTADEISLIYSSKPNQCSNCPKRFASTPEGAIARQQHLDWHFRTNKKLKDTGKQLYNRAWYLNDAKWIEFKEDEIVGYTSDTLETNRVVVKEALSEEEVNKQIVAIPEDSDNETVCGICREKLVGVFDDEMGEWIWRNAIEKKGRVYHYSCWVETKGNLRDRSPERK
ncbi:hypothetical protein KL905_000438 [Ogataea polymorpha]|nr:hypothetical protein KL937_000638 [Ogataea polymorpha]KAG7891849.1 hypothetical protein KL936_001792 [Ogataea polymorpha]KAG7895202.1 hypothetical protein KL908_001552 [Ogataea polymorpha]KAG7902316.1 hypothetical protein KL935_001224 [Ogataea polymorpha]KAG7911696.1 hypothetical protein KL906_001017 [Ogataea polymorpha]